MRVNQVVSCETHLLGETQHPMSWEPIDEELVRDGFIARVTRTIRAKRWRWVVSPQEYVQRRPSQPVEHASARGYAPTRERAREMAEAAITGIAGARRDPSRRGRST